MRDNKGTLGEKAQDMSRQLLENVAGAERQILKDVADVIREQLKQRHHQQSGNHRFGSKGVGLSALNSWCDRNILQREKAH